MSKGLGTKTGDFIAIPEQNFQALQVLLIEDNDLDAKLLMSILKDDTDQTLKITWVPTLKAGLEHLSRHHFDVVLLDLSLPDSFGVEAVQSLRRFSIEIPIVVLTASDDNEIALSCVKHGAQDYLVKGHPSQASIFRAMHYAVERCKAQTVTKQLKLWEQREHFIAMLAHDLRSPINASEKILSIVLDGSLGVLSESQSQLLSLVSGSHQTLLLMINNVLDAYKLEHGGDRIQIIRLDLGALINVCLKELKPIAIGKNIEILNFNTSVHSVFADPVAMRRVINNLLSNALKFTTTGGSINITLSELETHAVLTITDSGIGIAEENLPHLFERFYQADIKNRSEGLGLGLHLCKSLISAQNGKITCTSKVNKGTTFEVYLPLAFDTSVQILIVDDNAANRLVLEKILEILSLSSISVSNGRDAINATVNHAFDIIFMDIQMPEIDGLCIAKAMRSAGVKSSIIAYTAGGIENSEMFDEAGIDDILHKPIDVIRVRDIVKRWVKADAHVNLQPE